METLEYTPQETNINEGEDSNLRDTKQKVTEYKEVFVQSFTQAVDTIEREEIRNYVIKR